MTGVIGTFTGLYLAEKIQLLEAEPIATFTSGRRTGDPAFTSHQTGAGTTHYLATIPDADGTTTMLHWLLEQTGISPTIPGLPATAEVCRRGDILTVINHGPDPVAVTLPGTDLVHGKPHNRSDLQPFNWIIINTPTT